MFLSGSQCVASTKTQYQIFCYLRCFFLQSINFSKVEFRQISKHGEFKKLTVWLYLLNNGQYSTFAQLFYSFFSQNEHFHRFRIS